MGANMARRLKDCGFQVTAVYDTRLKAARELAAELGAEACKQLSKVTELADVIITVVSDDAAMEQIFSPAGKSLLKGAKGRLFINCATISPKTHVEVEARAAKAEAQSLEACMASSITQAREGTLYLMCGGSEEAFQRAKPILEKLSNSTRYIGKAGQAANVKALVNMVMNINTAALAEGLNVVHNADAGTRAVLVDAGRARLVHFDLDHTRAIMADVVRRWVAGGGTWAAPSTIGVGPALVAEPA